MEQLRKLEALRREPVIELVQRGNFRYYVDATDMKKRYRGICGTMRKLYYSGGTVMPQSRTTAASRRLAAKIKGPKGIELGKAVDDQLTMATLELNMLGLSVQDYVIAITGRVKGVSKKGETKGIETNDKIKYHPRVITILKYLSIKGWHPLVCQLPVCCSKTGIGTMMDMLCLDMNTLQYVAVELKSGFCAHYMTGAIQLSWPYSKMNDSDYCRHQLQHTGTSMLFGHTYGLAKDKYYSAIIRVDDEYIEQIPQAPWISNGEAHTRNALLSDGSVPASLPVGMKPFVMKAPEPIRIHTKRKTPAKRTSSTKTPSAKRQKKKKASSKKASTKKKKKPSKPKRKAAAATPAAPKAKRKPKPKPKKPSVGHYTQS